ncbi:hypothetical protein BU15DRAFT_65976 [Melanogaster broomeanus]|nr:hypothetical protein BU15DRAFT_65976 [Melanogaster broomeanus]
MASGNMLPSSPTFVSSLGGSSFGAPLSPTLSMQSPVQSATPLKLRENKPDERSGISSLHLLTPSTPDGPIHHRKGSFTSSHDGHSSLDETEPDHGDTELHLHTRLELDTTSLSVASSSSSQTHLDSASELLKPQSRPTEFVASYSDENVPSTSHHLPHVQVSSRARGRKESDDDQSILKISQDEEVDPVPFAFKSYELASLLDPKNLDALRALGGVNSILDGLGTHPTRGLLMGDPDRGDGHPSYGRPGAGEGASQRHDRNSKEAPVPFHASIEDRMRVFGENVLPQRSMRSLLGLMWLALKDKVLVLLSIAAVVSLALGLFQDFGTPRTPGEPPVDWVEGVAIMIAILILVVVGSLNDWQKERRFKVLNEKKEERGVKVIRNGVEHVIDVKEVVVGDIAILEPGEIVPCDGIFLSGHNVKCDESAATGETDAIKKAPGSKVLEGVGRYVVIAVGTKSFNGRIMMAKVGSIAGIILIGSLMICFFVQLGTEPYENRQPAGMAFVQILIISVTLVVIAVQQASLPLAVTLALAFATKRMARESLLVRVLGSCEITAKASVICTDKTGALTQNTMAVVAGSIGIHAKFVRRLKVNQARTNAAEVNQSSYLPPGQRDFSIDQSKLNTILPPQLRNLFNAAIAINSTAFEDEDPATKEVVIIGSKTETALLNFAKELQWAHYRSTRDTAEVVMQEVKISKSKDTEVPMTIVGSSNVMVTNTASSLVHHPVNADDFTQAVCFSTRISVFGRGTGKYLKPRHDVEHLLIVELAKDRSFHDNAAAVKIHIGKRWSVPCNALPNTLPERIFNADDADEKIKKIKTRMDILSIIVGRTPWWRPGDEITITDSDGSQCLSWRKRRSERKAMAVVVKLANGNYRLYIQGCQRDSYESVHSSRCRLTSAQSRRRRSAVVETAEIDKNPRKYLAHDQSFTQSDIANHRCLYRDFGTWPPQPLRPNDDGEMPYEPSLASYSIASSALKILSVTGSGGVADCQKGGRRATALGEIVCVTGDGTNDGPALKTAHVGSSMGFTGTGGSERGLDIILMDDNFSSIVKAIMWGRCVNDAVRKFLQFQLSTNVTAVVVTFVTGRRIVIGDFCAFRCPITWINIIMDTFAAFALATDPASPALLDRKPDRLSAPLFSVDMYKQIILQSTYQITITLIFHFLGLRILGLEETTTNDTVVQTMVFNAFVFAQIFNSVNSRRLDRKKNIFEGLLRNYYFIVITLIEIVVQVLIVFVGGAAFQVTTIGGREWGISLVLGVVSIPLGALIRLLPNGPFEKMFIAIRLLPSPEALPTIKPDAEWNLAIELVRDNLATFANLRGGRLRSSEFVGKSRSARPSIMTMVPTLIASSIGAGWAPQSHGSHSDPACYDPSKSSAALWEGKFQVHPDTTGRPDPSK